jgi:hypothetical protein
MANQQRHAADVSRSHNVIKVSGILSGTTGGYGILSALHHAVDSAGHKQLYLNLSRCEAAFCSAVLPICSQAMYLRNSGVEIELALPDAPALARLFVNTNWASLIDPKNHPSSTHRRPNAIPATCYTTSKEQTLIVNKVLSVILGTVEDIDRDNLAALEWSLNEITDNVLVHSESAIGGLVEVNLYPKVGSVEFLVCDAGLGIPNTLRSSFKDFTDVDALDRAIREGVTRDETLGRGNGLYGTSQVCRISNGEFAIASGHASLGYKDAALIVKHQAIPFHGALIMAKIGYKEKGLLERALVFEDGKYKPVDFIETSYEGSEEDVVNFNVLQESESFGTRPAGLVVRKKLMNFLRMAPHSKIRVSFEGISVISSSYADEVFGKMFAALGPTFFNNRIELIRMNRTVKLLIDKAIRERTSGI